MIEEPILLILLPILATTAIGVPLLGRHIRKRKSSLGGPLEREFFRRTLTASPLDTYLEIGADLKGLVGDKMRSLRRPPRYHLTKEMDISSKVSRLERVYVGNSRPSRGIAIKVARLEPAPSRPSRVIPDKIWHLREKYHLLGRTL